MVFDSGAPFLDGNNPTGDNISFFRIEVFTHNTILAFFLANEYIRAHAQPGLADGGEVGLVYKNSVKKVGKCYDDLLTTTYN